MQSIKCIYGKQMTPISHRNVSLIHVLLNRLKSPGSFFLEYYIKSKVTGFSQSKCIPLKYYLVKECRGQVKHLRSEKNRLSQDFRSTIKSPLKDTSTIPFHLILP